ncbi:Hypothetical_protein [Hexamita inflata]|uniref:Hypothetical_protein n=1 Tax=Hexamita inflata TaxID=28002 RepID=A0AA86N793_9EUKA|nr:Hypothetical protein HINF_LOCUS1899 [Hexamita inflata]
MKQNKQDDILPEEYYQGSKLKCLTEIWLESTIKAPTPIIIEALYVPDTLQLIIFNQPTQFLMSPKFPNEEIIANRKCKSFMLVETENSCKIVSTPDIVQYQSN